MNQLYEVAPLIAIVDPQTVANSEKLTNEIDMSLYFEVMAVAALGNMAAETIDIKAYESNQAGGTFTAITSQSATQLAAHATNNDSKQIILTVRPEQMKSTSTRLKFGMVTGGATGGPACIMVFGRPRYEPGQDKQLSSIVQLVK